jgi:large subunit ribosomal protein L5
MAPRLQTYYEDVVRPALADQFDYDSPMRIPRMSKVVVNIGLGEALENPKAVDAAIGDLRAITGQEPIKTLARKSVANFKLREGRVIGIKVTLRREKMWAFLDRLMNVALPRTRDFRGVSPKSFDGRGNYTLGLSEQLIFPELNYDQIDKVRGMEISIVTTAENDEEGREMMRLLGMPFAGLEVSAPEYARA